MITQKELDEIKDRCEKASPGPWHNFHKILKAEKALSPKYKVPKDWNIASFPHRSTDYPIPHVEYETNKEFIAHSRTDIPKLLDAVEKLRVALELYSRDDLPEILRQAIPKHARETLKEVFGD